MALLLYKQGFTSRGETKEQKSHAETQKGNIPPRDAKTLRKGEAERCLRHDRASGRARRESRGCAHCYPVTCSVTPQGSLCSQRLGVFGRVILHFSQRDFMNPSLEL